MTEYKQQIHDYLVAHKDDILADIASLIRIDSTVAQVDTGIDEKPYGEGSAKALDKAMELMEKYGMTTTNHGHYAVSGVMNDKPIALDILGHMDVVPAGEGWTKTDAFTPVIENDIIYGRGAADDKGPSMVALYALRAIRELGIPLSKQARLILGGCEEIHSTDIDTYFEYETHAPYTVSPDADFPVISAERGIAVAELGHQFTKKEASESSIVSIVCGERANVIPQKAKIEFKKVDREIIAAAARKICKKYAIDFELVPGRCGRTELTVIGVGGHASTPDTSKNALTALLEIVRELSGELVNDRLLGILCGLSLCYPMGKGHGEAMGIDMQDDETGRITSNLTVMNYSDGLWKARIDSRVPACANDDNFDNVVIERLTSIGLDHLDVVINERPPHVVPKASPLVQQILDSYESITGVRKEPLAIGGGTYVHGIENGVAFGCEELEEDFIMHGPNEYMPWKAILKSAEIYADVIINLCK